MNYYNARSSSRSNYEAKKKGARGIMVIVVGNGHSDTSSNPGLD